jgi:hypothetical protein
VAKLRGISVREVLGVWPKDGAKAETANAPETPRAVVPKEEKPSQEEAAADSGADGEGDT